MECSAVRLRRYICCSSMALPEIKYTKVKTPLFTELAFEDVQMKSEAVQMKSYSDWQGFFKGGCMGEATAPQTGF